MLLLWAHDFDTWRPDDCQEESEDNERSQDDHKNITNHIRNTAVTLIRQADVGRFCPELKCRECDFLFFILFFFLLCLVFCCSNYAKDFVTLGTKCLTLFSCTHVLRAVYLFLSLSLLLQVSALEAPPLAQGVANKTLIRVSAVVSGPKRQCEANRVE